MYQLLYDNFIKAKSYILANADAIGQAWFQYIFEDGTAGGFLDALAKYQQENGGFGGLYYEFDYQGVCLKSTEIAIKYILGMRERPPAGHPVIQKMMRYLLNQYLPETGNWGEVVVPEVNNGVHCYWVGYRNETPVPIKDENERIRLYDANERACFAAFVASYPQLVPEELYREILKYPIEHLLRYWDEISPDYNRYIFESGEPYQFEYFQDFVPCLKDKAMREKLASVLCQKPTAFMELDFTKSDRDYVHLPCDSVSSPDSVVYPAVKRLVDESLEYRMKQQRADGSWPLGWSFGESEGLKKLQAQYEAYQTLLLLVKLKRFHRIEGLT